MGLVLLLESGLKVEVDDLLWGGGGLISIRIISVSDSEVLP